MKRNSISAGLAVHARTITTTRRLIFRRACLWTGFLTFATIAFGPQPAQAAVTEAWVQRYGSEVGSGAEDSAHKVVTDAAGNAIVAGSTANQTGSDMLVIKYSSEGVSLWTNRYNGGGAIALAVDASGKVFVTGSSVGSGSYDDYATLAYSGAGVPLWTNRYGGLGSGNNIPKAVAVDGNGNAYSGTGVPLWTNRYNGPGNGDDTASALAVDGSGNVFVTGTSYVTGGDSEYATIAYSGAGVPLWTNRYNGPGYDSANAIAVDGSGNVFVTGSYVTIAYSGAGIPLWTNRYNGDVATAVAVDASGKVFVMGSSETIAYSGAGAPLWTNRASGTAIAVDSSGNVVVIGYGYYTAKYSGADGSLLWQQTYDGPHDGYDNATAVAVDASGNVVVTGHSGGPDTDLIEGDYYTAKYAAADGMLLWEKHYTGPANMADSATAVALDASGNVVVTGYVDSPPIFFGNIGGDYYTAKYAAADGATLWEKRFKRTLANGPNGPSPRVAVGPNGMIAVSGTSSGDYATVVYRDVPAVSIDLSSTGFHLRVTGLPGRSYNIERAPAVTGPWSTINTQTAPASGFFEYLDTNPPARAAFYRASEP